MTNYQPLKIRKFQKIKRKAIKSSVFPIPQEFIQQRKNISEDWIRKIDGVTQQMSTLNPEQRKAVFLKVEHGKGLNFSGTNLKQVFESGENFSIVQVKDVNLPNLKKKIQDFGTAPVDRKGHVKNEGFVFNLKAIVEVEPYSRVSEDLEVRLESIGDEGQSLICEIEIASDKVGKRQQKDELIEIRSKLTLTYPNIEILEHEDYFGTSRVLIRTSKKSLTSLISNMSLFQAVKWFDVCPTPQKTVSEIIRDFNFTQLHQIQPPSVDAPIICIIDSGVTEGNPFIKPLIKPELPPMSYISTNANAADEANHGTAVASLASYHSLKLEAGDKNEPKCWIASAKVLNAQNKLEEEKLFSNTLRAIVKYYKSHGVQIFNLSMVFENRVWNKSYIATRKIKKTSWIARTIDNISREEDVLFIICTGNIDGNILNNYIGSDEHYPAYFKNGDYSLQDPANATYAITVGSISGNAILTGQGNVVQLSPAQHPSPFTRRGPGILGDIKPEIVEIGGSLAFDRGLNKAVRHTNLNVIAANNAMTPVLTNGIGTSLAAPRAAFKAACILTDLKSLGINPSSNLLKAFMINSTESVILTIKDELSTNNVRSEDLVGYGQVNSNLALYNDPTNVVLYLEEKIPLDEILIVHIPIPIEVANLVGRKKLKITVSFSPEIQKAGLKKYHGSKFSWDIFRGDQTDDAIIETLSVNREDDQDEEDAPIALKNYKYGKRKRSKSCIQHDEFEWDLHKEEYSQHDYKLAISTQDVWKVNQTDIPVAIVINFSSQNSTNLPINIHNLIRNRVEIHTLVTR